MSGLNKEILEKAKSYVLQRLENELPSACIFHSPDHTLEVVENALLIGRAMNFTQSELYCLEMAALFHDTGYISGYAGHELRSVQMAVEFLEAELVDHEIIDQVARAIEATEVPQNPLDPISGALCDADLFHLALPDYFEKMELLRVEWKLSGRADYSVEEFHLQSISFFATHQYHTSYSKTQLQPKKDWNKRRILALLENIEKAKK